MTPCKMCGKPVPTVRHTYCSMQCAHQNELARRRELNKLQSYERRAAVYKGVKTGPKPVLIDDRKCGKPYYMSLNDYKLYKHDLARMGDVRVFIHGQEVAL